MKSSRTVRIHGKTFAVPARIQRCEDAHTHGWQVRYCGTMLFSDGAAGPRESLKAAIAELGARYRASPPPAAVVRVRSAALPHKTSDLPAGISGPILIRKPGRADSAEFKVSLPRRGKPNASTSVYIASETTWSAERYSVALAKALRLRQAAMRAFGMPA